MADVSYGTVMSVTMSWDRLKQVPNYQEKAGELIFCRLFELEPKARNMFGYSPTEDIRANPKFAIHAQSMVDMIDCAVGFLGPVRASSGYCTLKYVFVVSHGKSTSMGFRI